MNDDTKQIASAGRLLMVDSGEYSNYSVIGFFVVLRDFSPMGELASYLEKHQEQKDDYNFREDGFLAHLVVQGFLLEITSDRLFLGTYGKAGDVAFEPQ